MDVAFCFMEQSAHVYRNALANLRFSPNPVSECALASMIVLHPARHPFHAKWYAETAEGRSTVGEGRILALINREKCLVDVFMRPASRRGVSYEGERRILEQVPARRYRHDVEQVWGRDIPEVLGRTDEQVKANLLAILDDFWHHCFEAYWPRFRQVLDADVTYRAQMLAAMGPAAALAEVQPHFVVRGHDVLLPLGNDPWQPYEIDTAATGFTMLPTLVKWGMNLPNSGEADAVFSYRARGRGRLSEHQADTMTGLVGILGRTRTELLLSLDEPASSTAIALFMGVTTTAANQHLRALAAAGLLQTSRFGRYVLYERSQVADDLIAAN
ncbi:hypothetical protein EDD41_2432 [Luteococcus japonicus]|uniref:Helix-turn-helix protein n=2 Tax=Luteococcus japonicus TaxID=33984 RepID=A0A3N1ZWF1_9ACTN|nr:hypothetical protein EDD41_2432 [Luteococcus japonicus]